MEEDSTPKKSYCTQIFEFCFSEETHVAVSESQPPARLTPPTTPQPSRAHQALPPTFAQHSTHNQGASLSTDDASILARAHLSAAIPRPPMLTHRFRARSLSAVHRLFNNRSTPKSASRS